MYKNRYNTPLLDEIISRIKERAKKKLTIALVVCGIIGIAMTLACIKSSSGLADTLGCWIIPVLFAGCCLMPYYNAVRTKERIKRILYFIKCSDAVIESNLQKSEKLSEYVYLSDEYLFDFNIAQAAKLSEIKSVKKYMQMDLKGYAVVLWTTYGAQYIILKTKQQRNDAIEKINEAVSHAKKDYQY